MFSRTKIDQARVIEAQKETYKQLEGDRRAADALAKKEACEKAEQLRLEKAVERRKMQAAKAEERAAEDRVKNRIEAEMQLVPTLMASVKRQKSKEKHARIQEPSGLVCETPSKAEVPVQKQGRLSRVVKLPRRFDED